MSALYWITVWTVALIPFVAPPVLVVALLVPRSRRWLLRPLRRRRAARRERARAMTQARRDARTAVLEAELAALDAGELRLEAPPPGW